MSIKLFVRTEWQVSFHNMLGKVVETRMGN